VSDLFAEFNSVILATRLFSLDICHNLHGSEIITQCNLPCFCFYSCL